MTATAHEPEVLEREVAPSLPSVGGAAVDKQIATAKAYPRSVTNFIRRATEMATLTPEIAASCVYALPREGKIIEGPSARLAEICASAWTNLRIKAGATDNDDRYITATGEAWDVETNVAIAFEVRRRITTKNGKTYGDDMITVTGNAAASIALRNAVFKTVPSSFWRPIYNACRKVIAGEQQTFQVRRDEMLKAFNVMGVINERIYHALGVKGMQDITLDHMVHLTGFYNALKDGETTIEEAFPEAAAATGGPAPAQRKSQQATNDTANGHQNGTTVAAAAKPAEPPKPAAAAQPVEQTKVPRGRIVEVQPRGQGVWLIKLDTGYVCGTTNPNYADSADELRASGAVVELEARAPKNPANAPILEEINPVPAEE